MIKTKDILMASAAIFLLMPVLPVQSATVTTETVVTAKPVFNTKKINFMAFDANHDNILSMREVGQKLFKLYDTDGNEVIDNIEYKKQSVMTIIPMQKETFTFVDANSDGHIDSTSYSHKDFIKLSGLMRFDNDMNGLSPEEFLGVAFNILDDNNSKVIESDEWESAYTAMTHVKAADQDRYND